MGMEIIQQAEEKYRKHFAKIAKRIVVCAGTGCVANGSLQVKSALEEKLKQQGLDIPVDLKYENSTVQGVDVIGSGCQGFCQMGPLVNIEPEGIMYVKVSFDDVDEIIEQTIKQDKLIDRLLFKDTHDGRSCKGKHEIDFYSKQDRVVLKMCGAIDPGDINEYIYQGGYGAALKCYTEYSPEHVCKIMTDSGLRGRGGGGFPTGRKWELTRIEAANPKYIICNGDEGDPGAFMDRSAMEGNPHGVIEGMMIAARAVGATHGVIYVRAEYPLAVARMRHAVKSAEAHGILGESVFGLGQAFFIEVMEGAGAFVCGEETALIASVMGKRGMPSPKPPYPAQSGLQGKPTVINNVETFVTVPHIINIGAEAFRKVGTATSPGTKTFALTGHVVNTGLIEVPFGTTVREIVFDIGGGVTGPAGDINEKYFKAVQIGGPSGACLTREHFTLPLDFDSLKGIGAMVGSGGLVVMNTSTCIVQIARYFMQFTQNESCGKCLPCREGTKQMLHILDEIIAGRGTMKLLDDLQQLAHAVRISSLCGLGKSAPNPVLSTLRYFYDEYLEHVNEKRCTAEQCPALLKPHIVASLCKGCTVCLRTCPVGAIKGELKKAHEIDPEKCLRCAACAAVCKFKAIRGVGAKV